MDLTLSQILANPFFDQALRLASLLVICALVYGAARFWIVAAIQRLVQRSQTQWDDALVQSQVFLRLAHIAPALVAFFGARLVPGIEPSVESVVQRAAIAVMVVVSALALGALLSAANIIYAANPDNSHRPIKGYLTVVRILLYVLAGLSFVSVLLDRSPWIFVSGIGAMSAVLLLIFKDTILSLVASIQITGNNLVHVGDWIEMPKYGADGDVIDVALHTVKVQNWDKTITTVPTHALIADSFKNWRSMTESGGRRVKRSFFIDVNTIRFLEPEEVKRFESWALLRGYVHEKLGELDVHNSEEGRNPAINADLRRLTNVGMLRAYVLAYLRAHPMIHQDMTLLVRQLQPTPEGLPIEIYCFTNDTNWSVYEDVQADIFDHVLALAPDFGLRIFQRPSGADVEALARDPGAAVAVGDQ